MSNLTKHQITDGVLSIRDQQAQMYRYAADVEKMIKEDAYNADSLNKIMEGLIDYGTTCFGYEDALMEQSGYPTAEEHVRSHRTFIRRIELFREEAGKGKNVTKELMSILRIWLVGHIEGQDAELLETLEYWVAKRA